MGTHPPLEKSSGRRLTVISAVTASAYLFIIMEGLPNYLPSRSIMDSANDIHDAPGIHYFFHSYPAGYTYYTGETGIRLVPSLPDEEKRSALWNEKYEWRHPPGISGACRRYQ